MKKLIIPLLALSVIGLCCISVTAQMAAGKDQLLAKGPRIVVMDDPIIAPVLAENNVSVKAMRDFTKSFTSAASVKWYKTDDGQMAYFSEHGIKSRAVYNNKGHWLYTMRSYNEQDLPKAIRAQVKTVYYDYSITRVNEITADGKIVYFLRIEDAKRWATIRFCEGDDMDETESFLK